MEVNNFPMTQGIGNSNTRGIVHEVDEDTNPMIVLVYRYLLKKNEYTEYKIIVHSNLRL